MVDRNHDTTTMTDGNKNSRRDTILRRAAIFVAIITVACVIWLFVFNGWNTIIPMKSKDNDPVIDVTGTSQPTKLSLTDSATSNILLGNVYSTLYTIRNDGSLKSDVLSGWKTENGGLRLVMTLNKGMKASNGVDITPAVVVKSLHNNIQGSYPHADVVSTAISRVETDGQSVVVSLNHPMAILSLILAGPMGAIGTDGETVVKPGDISTGPYSIQSFGNGEAKLVRNRNWPAKTPNSITIKWTDEATASEDLSTLKATHVLSYSGTGPSLKDPSKYKRVDGPGTNGVMIVYNSRATRPYPTSSDVRYRRGLTQSVDRNALVGIIGNGLVANGSPIPLGSVYRGGDDGSSLSYDRRQAASATSYFGANPIRLLTPNDDGNTRQFITSSYRAIGQYVRSHGPSSSIGNGDWDVALIDHHGFDLGQYIDGNDLTGLEAPETMEAYDAVMNAGDEESLKTAIASLSSKLVQWSPGMWIGNYKDTLTARKTCTVPNPGMADVRIDLSGYSCSQS